MKLSGAHQEMVEWTMQADVEDDNQTETMGATLATAGGLSLADGPLPVGEAIGIGLIIYVGVYAITERPEAVPDTITPIPVDELIEEIYDTWKHDQKLPDPKPDFPPFPPPYDPIPRPKPKPDDAATCDSAPFNQYVRCARCHLYDYNSKEEAESVLDIYPDNMYRTCTAQPPEPSTEGPCSVGSPYHHGYHYNYLDEAGCRCGSIFNCLCCEDAGGTKYPRIKNVWGFSPPRQP